MPKLNGVDVPSELLSATKFFAAHAGWGKPKNGKKSDAYYKTEGGLKLAIAEQLAEEKGWKVKWEGDDLPYETDIPGDVPDEVLVAILYDEDNKVIGSLGGIGDPDRNYGRVVEAELALEALGDEAKQVSLSFGERDSSANEDNVRELVLYIDNDGDLYRQQTTSIMKNLAKKMVKGTYNHTLAIKLWGYLANAGAQKYTKEYDSPGGANGSYGAFSPADRKAAAVELADAFESAVKNGDYDVEKLAKGK